VDESNDYVALLAARPRRSIAENGGPLILPGRIGGLLPRRLLLAIACVLSFAGVLILFLESHRSWQAETESLARENLSLQLRQLSANVSRESADLKSAALTLAEAEGAIELVQDGANTPAAKFEPRAAAALGINTLLIASAAQSVRLSGVLIDGQFADRSPDPAAMRYLAAAIAARSAAATSLPGQAAAAFSNGQFIAASPIGARGSSAVQGWLVVTRSLSPEVLARLEDSVGGPVTARPVRQFDFDHAPSDVRAWLRAPASEPSGFGSRVSEEGSGYAVLRDESGSAAWIFSLARAPAAARVASRAASGTRMGEGLTLSLAGFLALLAALVTACAIIALKRYFRHRLAMDSRYKAIIDQTNDGIVIVDSENLCVQYCNPAFLERIGYTSAEAAELTLADLFADAESAPESVLARMKNADSQMALNLQVRAKGGALIEVEVRCNRLESNGRDGLAYVTHDVSVRRKAEQQLIDNQQRLDRMAHHDQLTALPNRHYLATFLPEAIAEAKAANTILGVVFLDLDRFKHINDTRGHETGDKLLQEVARRLRACVRDCDVVIRMGGDEFVVVFRNVRSYDEVTFGANRIIESLNRPIVIDQHPLQTSGSVGVSLFPRDGSDMGELLKHSDTAMYQAKDRGRNNVQMFSQIMNRKLKHRVAVEASLRDALRLKQLDVHYQPFVNLQTRKVVGLEALIRWRHPLHGMVPADQFIPVAEETGLIVPMGNFVLHRALQTLSAWQKTGVTLVPVSLNVAPAQLQRGELQSTISTLLKTHGLKPELLQLEMTERAVFDASQTKAGENRQDTMVRLRDLGIKIAIDDFGTGYSSLSYLKNWRVDALKIDRSFVRDLVTDSSDLAIVSAIIAIARHLHIQVIAEGIEAYQQAEILRKLGCTIGQGFLFARPMPAEECLAMLGDNVSGIAEEEDMLAAFASGRA
jgi:diguanylate cyclase (GGDEF)-like protein/PAS domain S-box-containing protein